MFPGRIRPGLIEARRRDATQAGRRQGFRGGFAPASLKPDDEDSNGDPDPPFPGRIRPGLIEA